MNSPQRILTVITIAALALTALYAPWDLTGSPNHSNVIKYAPLFAPPPLDVWTKRELASGILWSWFVLGVMYAGLFLALKEATNGPEHQLANA